MVNSKAGISAVRKDSIPPGATNDDRLPKSACDTSGKVDAEPDSDACKIAELVRVAEQYRRQLLWLAARMINRREEAEDIVQRALMKAYVNLSQFRGVSKMATWLRTIVQNTAREYMRNERRRPFVALEPALYIQRDGEEFDVPDSSLNPEEQYEHNERHEIVSRAVGCMGKTNRRVVELCVFEGLPYAEVAAVLDIPLSTVKSRMFRSRRNLRMSVLSRGG